ncbi:methyltransferase, TIGR04325 family [Nostoc punctiforme FACHB-252]|uniref:Methyltransferase, TIGR04325 family n=1 Tax=Nostoc punctiforme FACHB-252 TaxID=1357509 RepID=A0ABR8H4I0_NOSPU|nr:methyltransferase, TIGR04325 family [Nostoc punctiforme]MBD2610742.1 methyltransferase, TIGR04325 family [Nostoc punctiforme FACHB-252]
MNTIDNISSVFDKYQQLDSQSALNQLQICRYQIAKDWLNISENNLKHNYLDNQKKSYQFLLRNNLKHEFLTKVEQAFVDEIVAMRYQSVTPPDWEYLPNGWATPDSHIKGWDVESILQIRRHNFRELLKLVETSSPLTNSYSVHNTYTTYAYILALAAHKKDRISILDWGGGIGDYYLISKILMPHLEIDYYCKEVPVICEGGREVLPEVTFFDKEEDCFQQSYDLVLASSSLQYSEFWQQIAKKLAAVSRSYLYITRMPMVHRASSFVVIQRPYRYGYHTEYMGWFLNREEFLNYVTSLKMKLVREFLIEERFLVQDAPEPGECRGFLFCPQMDSSKI